MSWNSIFQIRRVQRRALITHRWSLYSTKTADYCYDTNAPWLRKNADDTIPNIMNFINGEFVPSKAISFIDVTNPATNQVISRVPIT
jgi:hypothetical protein